MQLCSIDTSISNDNVIESLDQVGILFLSDLSRQECSTYTTTSEHEFDVPDSPSGHGGGRFVQTTHTMEKGHQMCRTRDRIAFKSTWENSTLVRTSQSARRNQETHLALHRVRGGQDQTSLELHRVRGGTKHGFCTSKCTRDTDSHCSGCADTNLFSAEFTVRKTRIRSTTPKRITMNDASNAALLLMG